MRDIDTVRVPVTCDCGTNFEVPIGGMDLDGLTFTCTGCGTVDQFTDDQKKQIVAQYDAAVEQINEAIRKAAR
jgi:RNase P subunit RPR2